MTQLIKFFGMIKFQKKMATISIDSVMKMDKKNYPKVYLEEYKYKIKKKNMTRLIDVELDLSDSE